MSAKRDYYQVLGIDRQATEEDVKKAFRRLARQYHPDVSKSPDAEARFKEINEAYEILSDREKRSTYDRFGHAGPQASAGGFTDFAGFGIDDLFESFFGGMRGGATARRGPAVGADLRYDLTVEFEEAAFGCEKQITILKREACPHCMGSGAEPGTQPIRCPQCGGTGEMRRQMGGIFVQVDTCSRCRGEGEIAMTPCTQCQGRKLVQVERTISVSIPAGVDEGHSVRLRGLGEPGVRGGPPGNLYVVLHVKHHAFFRREENNVVLELGINIAQAALGDRIRVPTLEGQDELIIPAGTQTGETFRLRGRGIPYLRHNGRGDQLVVVQVLTPTRLNARQRELLSELGQTLGHEEVQSGEKGFFQRLKEAIGIQ
jgi:molecular chaperone DnaJ